MRLLSTLREYWTKLDNFDFSTLTPGSGLLLGQGCFWVRAASGSGLLLGPLIHSYMFKVGFKCC